MHLYTKKLMIWKNKKKKIKKPYGNTDRHYIKHNLLVRKM